MFNRAIRWQLKMPKYLSTDNDPLYRFHQWLANLRVLEVTKERASWAQAWTHRQGPYSPG